MGRQEGDGPEDYNFSDLLRGGILLEYRATHIIHIGEALCCHLYKLLCVSHELFVLGLQC